AETACARLSRAAWSWPSSQTRRCPMVLAFRPWGPGRPRRATPCGMLSATREPEGRCREFASCHVLPWLVDTDREADTRSADQRWAIAWHFAFTAQLTGCSQVPVDLALFIGVAALPHQSVREGWSKLHRLAARMRC